MQFKFGIFGLGVMGSSIALNFIRNKIPVSVFNYTYDLTEKFVQRTGSNNNILGAKTVHEFVSSLERPRRILLMVTAGKIVDQVIARLKPFLEAGDIIIDGGNSHFSDTDRRIEELENTGIQYIGMGVSGGEQGALWGPSLMPGGDAGVFKYLEPFFTIIAAKAGNDEPCMAYIGKKSAGHFVKMVHNGIEYGDMQLIAEAYDLLRFGLGLKPDKIADVFKKWNQEELSSFLIEITSEIVNFPDDLVTGKILLDQILDKAGMKGTGTWTGQAALDLGEPIPTIIAALHARALSGLDEERQLAQKAYGAQVLPFKGNTEEWIHKIKAAVYNSKICSYAQGFVLLQRASLEYGYNLNLAEIARIWRGGCIIRASFLDKINKAFEHDKSLSNLLIDPGFINEIIPRVEHWRSVVAESVTTGIPIPAISASLAYFESLRRDVLPANLIQAQRDYFGAHSYKRNDRPGIFHSNWIRKEN